MISWINHSIFSRVGQEPIPGRKKAENGIDICDLNRYNLPNLFLEETLMRFIGGGIFYFGYYSFTKKRNSALCCRF